MKTSKSSGQSTSDSRSLKGMMQQHPLFYFFFLSYVFSWIMSLPAVLSVWGVLPGDYTIGLMLKQWIGPALAAIIMTNIVEGKAGMLDLRRRVRQWRVGWQWYVFILLGIPALILLGIMIQPGMLASFHGLPPGLLTNYLWYMVAIFIGVGLPEEIGWRGFALPRMQARYGPLVGSLLLGVVWAFWHLLYFLLPDHGGGPNTGIAAILINFSLFFLMIVALAIIFTWVFNHTRGSIFIAGLLHAAIDAPQLVWLPLFINVGVSNSVEGETSLTLASLFTFGVLALLIVILTRGRLGYQPSQELPLRPGGI